MLAGRVLERAAAQRGWLEPSLRPASIVLTGAALVLHDRIEHADLWLQDGVISGIGASPRDAVRVDCLDCDVLPGLIDLHTDNIERHLEPRPGIFQAPEAAVMAHDAELAAAGVTTALDAITLGGGFLSGQRQRFAARASDVLRAARGLDLLRIDHALHVRCELSDGALPAIVEKLGDPHPLVVSLMNHTPGKRQWRDLQKFHTHYARRYGLSRDEIAQLIAARQASADTVVPHNRAIATAFAVRVGARLASHDDTDARDVDDAAAIGCTLTEFPTTDSAAAHAARLGLAVIAGAPNLVAGGSHSGNVAAADLARNGHLHVLASDYSPNSLLRAVYLLHRELGWSLAAAARTVSSTPARLVGLDDRGEIAIGRRADVIVVSHTELGPVIRETWSAGQRVF